jgi:hypothetical protein
VRGASSNGRSYREHKDKSGISEKEFYMRKMIPPGGLFFKLNRPEEQNLYAIAATLVAEDAEKELTNSQFFVELMKNYVRTRNPLPDLGSLNSKIHM